MSAPLKSSRSTTSPVPEPPACGPAAVATVPAKIVTKPSANSAHTARATAASAARSPRCQAGRARHTSTPGGDDHHHREHQVGHHPARGEAVEHGQPAHHRLAEDAEREQPAEDRQVAPERAARERQHERGDRADADHAGQQPVAELDVGVGAELGREPPVLVAVGPVRAAEPGARDAHGRAREDDQHQRPERHGGDPEVLLRGEADPLHASAIVAAAPLNRRGRRPWSPPARRPARATGPRAASGAMRSSERAPAGAFSAGRVRARRRRAGGA